MPKKNIYTIDNWLINIGRILFVIFFISTCSRASDQNYDWVSPALGLFIAIGLLIVGNIIRRREQQIIAVWNILEHSTEVSAQELRQHTGFNTLFIEDALRLINGRGHAYYIWDKDQDKIIDGRLRTVVLTDVKCGNCGAKINEITRLDTHKTPTCTYCGQSVSANKINQLKSEAMDKIRHSSATHNNTKGFSLWVFILLLIIFWPAAVAYALWKSYLEKKF
ncbi:MAG: hypothetical protein KAG28_00515 [Cocleimonas sp.]|nr:hypothetical protein [Cocleimonas sp.]